MDENRAMIFKRLCQLEQQPPTRTNRMRVETLRVYAHNVLTIERRAILRLPQ